MEFFAKNAPDPLRWTLNSCIAALHSVWVHYVLFCYFTKLCAKQAELVQLMQKLLPRSRIGIFATNTTDPSHWTLNSCFGASSIVWVHFGLFRYSMKLGVKQFELVQLMQKFVPQSRIGIFATNAPDPPHWTLNSCFGASRSIWVHLAIFHYYTKLGAKRVELVQLMHKFVP